MTRLKAHLRLARHLRWLVPLVVLVCAQSASAQIPSQVGQLPTAEQARELLRTRPDLAEQVRQRLMESGLTEDQVRARLRAAGYPDDLIDELLQGVEIPTTPGTAAPAGRIPTTGDLLNVEQPTDTAQQATSEESQAQPPARSFDLYEQQEARFIRDSLRADSLRIPWSRPVQIFGLDVFRRRSTEFQPTRFGPVPDSYRLGPGDRLSLVLSGEVQRAYNLEVSRDGMVLIPQAGQLPVANLTMPELNRQLVTRLRRVYSGVDTGPDARTRLSVTVTRVRSVQVFVIGDVVRPGAYDIAATSTGLTALYAAGGPTGNGSFRSIQIRRGGKLVDSLDLYSYLLSGLNRPDVSLQNGDQIFVTVHGAQVKIAGQVIRPAIYELTERETLRDLVEYAGGFQPTALRQRIQIHRTLPADPGEAGKARVVVDIAPEEFASGIPRVPMFPGDSVTVFEVADRVSSYVRVDGDVWHSGVVGFRPGMRLSEAIRFAGGPKPDVYLDQILISRLRPDSTRVQLRASFADSTGKVANDIELQEADEIRVFARTTFRAERYVVVTGAVRKPGRIRYRESMTVRDAILLADGLSEDAYLKEAEIARVPDDRSKGAVSATIRVPLDSTYLFARSPGDYPGPPGVPAPASGSPEIRLQPYDNILVLRQPEWELPRTIKITGQVKYPGPYALRTKTERLADIIQRAGGLTREAYPDAIEFYRRQDSVGRVGIELPKVLKNRRYRDNVILVAGDSINIPEYIPTVQVVGLVNAPGAVAYEPKRNLDWYIRAAGGYSKTGDKTRAYLTQPNGEKETVQRRFMLADHVPKPRPGAVVFVPERPANQQPSQLPAILGVTAQVLAGLVTIIVVAKR